MHILAEKGPITGLVFRLYLCFDLVFIKEKLLLQYD